QQLGSAQQLGSSQQPQWLLRRRLRRRSSRPGRSQQLLQHESSTQQLGSAQQVGSQQPPRWRSLPNRRSRRPGRSQQVLQHESSTQQLGSAQQDGSQPHPPSKPAPKLGLARATLIKSAPNRFHFIRVHLLFMRVLPNPGLGMLNSRR